MAEYYSLFWYIVIFLIAAFTWRRDVKAKDGARVLPRWAVFGILCYIPYGYVLIVGEQSFFREYVMDSQLIVFSLLPASMWK